MWSKCSDRFHGVSGSWHVTKVTLGVPELWAHTGKPVDTPKLAAQKKSGGGGAWRRYQESVCNWKLQENFFSSFQIHRILPKQEQNFFFFFFWNVQLCETSLVSDLHRNLEPSCFYPNKFKLKNLFSKLGAYLHQETTFPNSLTYKHLGPVELTNCAKASDMLCHLFHFIQGWLLAFTVLGTRWEIKKKKKLAWYLFCALKELFWIFEEPST